MVILSDETENVLNRILLVGIAYNGEIPPLYGKARTAILNLDKSALYTHASSVNNAPFAWKRDNTLVLVVDNLMFSYETSVLEDGDICVVIHEVAENGIIVNEVHNKLKLIIKEALKECLYDFC